MKIIFCGPPHSGKSVFINNLKELLPSDGFIIDRIHLDGEGDWSNNHKQDEIQLVRNKRSYGIEFIETKVEALKNKESIPIILVDIGGKLTDDKIPVFKACDSFIVISNDKGLKNQWESFGKECGCECIACLDSELDGDDEIYDTQLCIRGRITNLIRGKQIRENKVIETIADIIINKSGYVPFYHTEHNVIDFNKICIDIGAFNSRVTKYGQTINHIHCEPKHALMIYNFLLENYSINNNVKLYGARTNWVCAMSSMLYHSMNVNAIEIFDITLMKYVTISKLQKKDNYQSEFVSYTVCTSEQAVFLNVEIIPEQITPEIFYKNCCIPNITIYKQLFVSGKIPLWMLNAILISYDAPEVYVFQPGNYFLCCWSNDKSNIGSIQSDPTGLELKEILK